MRFLTTVLLLLVAVSSALGQTSPGWTGGEQPTPSDWNALFAGKQDYPPPGQSNVPTQVIPVLIGTGNTFQGVAGLTAGATSRHSLTIQNNNTNGDNCWVFIGPTASATKATAILLAPGQSYGRYGPYLPSDNIAVTCATTNDTMYADVQ